MLQFSCLRVKDKNKYLCLAKFFRVSICFIFHRPGYSVAAQARKLEHLKKYLLEKIWLYPQLWAMYD
jgi:hypothetical protein